VLPTLQNIEVMQARRACKMVSEEGLYFSYCILARSHVVELWLISQAGRQRPCDISAAIRILPADRDGLQSLVEHVLFWIS